MTTWAPAHERPGSFFGRFRAVSPAKFANAIVLLYAVSLVLGGIVYLYFRVDIRPDLERAAHWQALGLFDLKEHYDRVRLPHYAVVSTLVRMASCYRSPWVKCVQGISGNFESTSDQC